MAHGKGRLIHSDADGIYIDKIYQNYLLIWKYFDLQSMRESGRMIKLMVMILTNILMEPSILASG